MQTVIGAFDDRSAAQRAVEKLVTLGIPRTEIHVEQSDSDVVDPTPYASTSTAEKRDHYGPISNFFANLFGEERYDERHMHRYSEAVRRGHSVVVVDAATDEQADKASTLLHELGAIDVDERAEEWRKSGWKEPKMRTNDTRTGDKLDVVQEELKVGKRAIDRGGVRVFQRVSEKPVRELVRLREERAVVDRKPVNREATAADLSNMREGTVEVRESAEEPVVSKKARVVEEVRVGKDVKEREQTIEDSVRRKDVEVERIPGSRETERERAAAAERTEEDLAKKPRKNL
jgi:uncharacterized protein (TIGR02271 family)